MNIFSHAIYPRLNRLIFNITVLLGRARPRIKRFELFSETQFVCVLDKQKVPNKFYHLIYLMPLAENQNDHFILLHVFFFFFDGLNWKVNTRICESTTNWKRKRMKIPKNEMTSKTTKPNGKVRQSKRDKKRVTGHIYKKILNTLVNLIYIEKAKCLNMKSLISGKKKYHRNK